MRFSFCCISQYESTNLGLYSTNIGMLQGFSLLSSLDTLNNASISFVLNNVYIQNMDDIYIYINMIIVFSKSLNIYSV